MPDTSTVVAVVGSANLDIVLELAAAPLPGQTVLGRAVSEHCGGKGANQAVAAGRLVQTAFVGAVGRDDAGERIVDNLRRHEIQVTRVQRAEAPSGRAYITVADDGENSIVVIPGASSTLTPETVTAALDALDPRIVVAQLEVPQESVDAAAGWTRTRSRRFILNASPVRDIDPQVLALADPLIVNADEAAHILGVSPDDADPAHLAEHLLTVARSAIVTAGSAGAVVAEDRTISAVAAEKVRALDTTGAGDEFAGTVAAALAIGAPLAEAARLAGAASARLIQLARADR